MRCLRFHTTDSPAKLTRLISALGSPVSVGNFCRSISIECSLDGILFLYAFVSGVESKLACPKTPFTISVMHAEKASLNPLPAAGIFSTPTDMPIPDGLNFVLVGVVFTGAIALLWLASHVPHWYEILAVGILFSYLLLTNYALLHEATHGNLQSSSRRNYSLGFLTGILFPIPFSMIRITHQGHHEHNRTDAEMFDLYYPHDNRVLKYFRWYSILCGLFWPIIPIGAILFSIGPPRWREQFFGRRPSTGYLFGGVQRASVWAIRAELLAIIGFFVILHWLLGLHWLTTLFLYACFSLNWSTRQYVGHAFSKRDIMEGAWNLQHNHLMTWVLLHGEFDKNHHRRPDVSWYYLPRLSPADENRPSYFKHYWRQWLGPRPNTEPAPVVPSSGMLLPRQ